MDFDLTDDQKEIKRVAKELLAARSSFAKVREAAEAAEYDGALWQELRELGWPGIAVAEEHGGQGLGAVELAVLLEELGYACAATPYLSTAVAAAVIQSAGTPEQQARWLPELASGESTAAIGTADLMADGVGAAVAVVIDGTRRVPDRVAQRRGAHHDRLDTTLRDRQPATASRSGPHAAARIHAAIAAEVVGISQRALDMTLEYVKERKQFGVPVGSFQAVSHRCAQMLLHTESARSTAYYAAWAADADPDRLAEGSALAAAAAADGGREVTASAIQAHGGIGFTWEADVHWLYKRAQLDTAMLGGARRHREALARSAADRVAASAR